MTDNLGSGYDVRVYYDEVLNAIVVANRGTEIEKGDIEADYFQHMGAKELQYQLAIELARELVNNTDMDVIFTGHSLGGGLASAQALAVNGMAITFNAAGVHADTLERNKVSDNNYTIDFKGNVENNNLRAYQVDGEILTSLQESVVMDGLSLLLNTTVRNMLEYRAKVDDPNSDILLGFAHVPEAVGTKIKIDPVQVFETKDSLGLTKYMPGKPINANSVVPISTGGKLHTRDYIYAALRNHQTNIYRDFWSEIDSVKRYYR